MIELHGVTKLYKTVIGVNDITLSLPPGTYGLLGPNGSGKTTLINLIIGQLRPTLGYVRLFGQDPWARDSLLRQVGLCPALEVNYPRVTGLEWVRYLVQLHGFNRREASCRAVEALQQVKLDNDMHRPMRNYSLGMRQRAKLAQAIAHDPELLILDEPFNGLDPVGRREMKDFLFDWQRRGRSLILASHILHEVEAVKPSFLLISGGRLLASGSPEDVRSILANTPNTLRVRTDNPRKLMSAIVELPVVDAVRLHEPGKNEEGSIEIDTRSTAGLLEHMPGILASHEIRVFEIQSADDSLKHLFSTLMRIHRGETKGGLI
jgi:ABC-2 type transport system ATP-binding protein